MVGPCAKQVVKCTIITRTGKRFLGENSCQHPQVTCPRTPNDDYTKCKTICRQEGHAETMALVAAGEAVKGAHAYVEGHTYACRHCQEALFKAGLAAMTIGAPPESADYMARNL